MKLLTKTQEKKLKTNASRVAASDTDRPVVKLFDAFGSAWWLLTELDEKGYAFGIADLGVGCPEYGLISLEELKSLTLAGVPRVERDVYFEAKKTLSEYLADAKKGVRP